VKIYTRTGDQGRTSMLTGRQVMKDDPLIEAYGTVDELIAYIGLIRDLSDDGQSDEVLYKIQDVLMKGASLLSAGENIDTIDGLPVITRKDIRFLEHNIDIMEAELPLLKHFILPGGYVPASHCHIARTICRRAERRVVAAGFGNDRIKMVLQYLNRLSDYLFVLARWLIKKSNNLETYWNTDS